jgi:integrase
MTLRIALSNAVREEVLTRHVAALVRVPQSRSQKEKAWSVEVALQFLESARAGDDPLYVGYVLILVLGMRRGEALGLGWADVDLDARELRVVWQLQRVGGRLLRRQTKTEASEAPLPLPGDLHGGAEGATGTSGWLARLRRLSLARQRSCSQHPARAAGRATHLPPGLQDPLRQGRRSPHLGARHPAYLRLATRRPRRAPPGGHAGTAGTARSRSR